MNKILSIIIVTYNSENLISDCLDSIYKFNDIGNSLEVIIVDNSKDSFSFFSIIKAKYSHAIKLISNPQNGGYGQGNNIGVAQSASPYILIMNPDVRLIEPIFKKLILHLETNQNVNLIGIKQVTESRRNSMAFFYKFEHANILRTIVLNKLYNYLNYFNSSTMYLSGAFLLMRKSIFFKIGGFDENIFLYAEEPEITKRIEKASDVSECVYIPNLKIIHLEKKSFYSIDTLALSIRSAIYYFEKHNLDKRKYLSHLRKFYFLKSILSLNRDEKAIATKCLCLLNKYHDEI